MATIKKSDRGTIFHYDDEGLLHCDDGPAVIFHNGQRRYYHRGKLDRIDGPAVLYPDSTPGLYYINDRHYTEKEYKLITFFLKKPGCAV